MRVLVFAHVPPPFHGQSYMVRLMLENVGKSSSGADGHPALFHLNARLSDGTEDIGVWRAGKFFRLARYILQAWWMRWKYSLDAFYYVPAPPAKRGALYRDWLVLFLAAPVFKIRIFHWHATGLGPWVAQGASGGGFRRLEAWITRKLFSPHDLSICLSNYARDEAAYFGARKTVVIPNGIPDPCPDFDLDVWPGRQQRAGELAAIWSRQTKAPLCYEVLFLSGRMTEKGLFDAMAAAVRANRLLQEKDFPLRMRLTVAGIFADETERSRYAAAAQELDATQLPGSTGPLAVLAGWADEERKKRLYRQADCFIFPTTYPAESFGLVLAEAMAHGCAIITTRWQAVPEVLPGGYPDLVEPHDIEAMAETLLRCAAQPADHSLRDYFLARFTSERFTLEMQNILDEP